MVTQDDDKRSEEEKICFDLFATMLLAFGGDDEIRGRHEEEQDANLLMIHTLASAATNTFLLGKRKIDDRESKNQENTSSSRSLVESKRCRVVSDDEPIRAQPIREIRPPVRERKRPVKRREPVRREPRMTPGWLVELMRRYKGEEDAKMIFEKVMTKTDLTPNHGRLLMPFYQMSEVDFLTKAESKILEEHHKGKHAKKKGVDVILLNRSGKKRWNLNMRLWKMGSSFNYALCTGWNQVVLDNSLQRNQTITLWSFHSRDGTLYFAFDPHPTQDQDEAMSLALVPVTHAASSSPTALAEDPFVCEETNRRLYPFPKRRTTPRVCVQILTSDSSNLLEGGLDLHRTPPEVGTVMAQDLEAVQETHITSTSQESLTETTLDPEPRL